VSIVSRNYVNTVPLIAHVCYTCGHIELETDPEQYRKYRQEWVNIKVARYLHEAEYWDHLPIPKSFEISLSSLARKTGIQTKKMTELIDGVVEWINVRENFWSGSVSMLRHKHADGQITFRVEGSGKNAKLVAKDTRPPIEPPPLRG